MRDNIIQRRKASGADNYQRLSWVFYVGLLSVYGAFCVESMWQSAITLLTFDIVTEVSSNTFKNLTKNEELSLDTQVGIISGLRAFVAAVAGPLVGYAIQCCHKRSLYVALVFVCGNLITLCSAAGFAFSNSFSDLVISRTIQGMGTILTVIAGNLYAIELTSSLRDKQLRKKYLFLVQMGSPAGVFFGRIVVIFYDYTGRYPLCILFGIICMIDALLRVLVQMKSPTHTKIGPSHDDEEKTTLKRVKNIPIKETNTVRGLFEVLSNGYIILILCANVLVQAKMATFATLLPEWLFVVYSANNAQLGVILSVSFGIAVALQGIKAKLLDSCHIYAIIIGAGLINLSTTIMTFTLRYGLKHWALLILPITLMNISHVIFFGVAMVALIMLVEKFHPSHTSFAMGLNEFAYSLGHLTPMFTGYLAYLIGYEELCYIMSGFLTIISSLTYVYRSIDGL